MQRCVGGGKKKEAKELLHSTSKRPGEWPALSHRQAAENEKQ